MQVIVIAIWDLTDKVMTRPIELTSRTKELKLNGRKPNKIIVPESLIDSKLLKKVKRLGSFNCMIIKATGK